MDIFLEDARHLISLINGLALFVLGLSVALESGGLSARKLAGPLRMLAGYGFVAAMANWLRMFMLIQMRPLPADYYLFLQTARLFCFVLGAALLLRFATQLIAGTFSRYAWVAWGLPVLGGLYLLAVASLFVVPLARQGDWMLRADVYARQFLLLPGMALAALGLWGEHRQAAREGLSRIAADSLGASLAFGLKAITSGLVSFPVFGPTESLPLIPAVAIFASRTLGSVAIAYFMARFLRALESERNRQFELALEQQFEARRETLAAQQQLQSEVERLARQFETVVDSIASVRSSAATLEDRLDAALAEILLLTEFDAGSILLVQPGAHELESIVQSGLSVEVHRCGTCFQLAMKAAGDAPTSHDMVVVWDLLEHADGVCNSCVAAGFRCGVSVPVTCRGHLLGIMNLLSRSGGVPETQQLRMLSVIGRQIGVAIEDARLYEQAQSMATLEERVRLGRELHDGLAQVLGYLHLKIHSSTALLASGQTTAAHDVLSEMHDVTQDTLKDVRGSILGLRTTIAPGTGLMPTLAEYVRKFSQQSGISAELVVREGAQLELGPAVEIQLLRIVQEALGNTAKHSKASHAWVRFGVEDGSILVHIQDNGRGFDAAGIDPGVHYGVQTMRERAESVGGNLQILTGIGQGTNVTVRLPFHDRRG